jgi:hypothetical protein
MKARVWTVGSNQMLDKAEKISEEYMVVPIIEAANASIKKQSKNDPTIKRYVKKSLILHLNWILHVIYKSCRFYNINFKILVFSAIATWLLFKLFPATPDAPNIIEAFIGIFSVMEAILGSQKQYSLKQEDPD